MSEDKHEVEGAEPKGITLAPAVTALLMPTAKLLGTRLRDAVKSKLDQWDNERRAKNLAAHLERNRVALEAASKVEKAPNDLKLIPKWVDAIEDVDPSDDALSTAWDNVLSTILTNDPFASVLFDKLQSLSTAEVDVLLHFRKRRLGFPTSHTHDQILTSLAHKGLLRRLSLFPLIVAGVAIGGAILSYVLDGWFAAATPAALASGASGMLELWTSFKILACVVLAWTLFTYYLGGFATRVYWVTFIGRQLLRTAP